jgi:hypothetical protein
MKGSKDDATIVIYNGQIYKGIEELGFNADGKFIIDLWTTEPGDRRGGFFTTPPIMDKETRKSWDTKCGYRVVSSNELYVYDDWGTRFIIKSNPSVIAQLIIELDENELPRRQT